MTWAADSRQAVAPGGLPTVLRSVTLTEHGPELRPGLDWSPRHGHGVLVRPVVMGICRSDYKEVARQRQGPSQFGHEVVGEVVARWGSAPFRPGEWVCLDPNRPLNRGTAFADLMPADGAPDALDAALHRVPRQVPVERAVFAEPLACAVHCLDQTARQLGGSITGRRVVVIGAGIAGSLIALGARASGARVGLVNARPERLRFLAERGLVPGQVLGPDDPLDERPSAIILATAFIEPGWLRWSLDRVAPGGAILLYGGTARGDRFVEGGAVMDLDELRREEGSLSITWNGKALIVAGSYGTEPSCFARGFHWLVTGGDAWPLERLVQGRIDLTALPGELLDGARRHQLGKIVVTP